MTGIRVWYYSSFGYAKQSLLKLRHPRFVIKVSLFKQKNHKVTQSSFMENNQESVNYFLKENIKLQINL